jgi:dephospho-CoA kinase
VSVLRVGLTGGVASGKSTVAGMLGAKGAQLRDADSVVAELYRPGGEGAEEVGRLFGRAVLSAAGGVDAGALAEVVLHDAAARRRLERAVHPLVRAELARWFAVLEGLAVPVPVPVAVAEAALLVETGSFRSFDRLVVVSADAEARRRRALAAGWSSERFERVVAAQLADEAREAVADYVVRNDGSLAALGAAVDDLWALLLEDAAALAAGRPLALRRAE